MYDVAIIGAGAAGISAAITLQSRGKSVLLLGKKELSNKMALASEIRNYPGLGFVSGQEFADAFKNHLAQMNIGITDKQVNEISKSADSFSILCGNDTLSAYSVILAMGVSTAKPYPNEEELLGKGVSYCATCDGFLYSQKAIAVVCTSKDFESEIDYLASVASDVYLVAAYKNPKQFKENVHFISGKNFEIKGNNHVKGIVCDGNEIAVDGVFILRDLIAPTNLIKGIEVDGSHIKIKQDCSTNIEGCFAAGDCTGRPYQYVKAAGQGNVAAHSVLEYLDKYEYEGTSKTRPHKTYPLSFMDAIEVTDISNLPTNEQIKDIVQFKLTSGECEFIAKDSVELGDVVYIGAKSEIARFNKENIALTVGQYLYDYEVEKALIGLKKGDSFTIYKNEKEVTITVLDIYKAVNKEPTDDMVKALGIPNIDTIAKYHAMIKDETEQNEIYMIYYNVVNELLSQEPPFETTKEVTDRLGQLELAFFNELFKKEKGKGIDEMTSEELQANLGVPSPAVFLESRQEWYKMKHQQVLMFSRLLDIELKDQYDFMQNYEALGNLQNEALLRLKNVVLKKEEA